MRINDYVFKYRSLLFISIFIIGFGAFPGPSMTTNLFILWHLTITQLKIFVTACSLAGIAGFFIRIWGAGYLGPSIVHSREMHSESLITSGPYAHMRNPLYFGALLMIVGFLPVLTLYGFVFIIAALGVLIYALIREEEIAMLAVHGKEYLKYKSMTHAIIPKFRKAEVSGLGVSNIKFSITNGFKSEILYVFVFSTLIGGILFSSLAFEISFYSLLVTGVILFLVFNGTR